MTTQLTTHPISSVHPFPRSLFEAPSTLQTSAPAHPHADRFYQRPFQAPDQVLWLTEATGGLAASQDPTADPAILFAGNQALPCGKQSTPGWKNLLLNGGEEAECWQDEPSQLTQREVCDTSSTSGEHAHGPLLECGADDANQTVSEILSLLSANSAQEKPAEVLLPASPSIYQRSKVLSAPRASDVPLL